jgi:hypothetical protein
VYQESGIASKNHRIIASYRDNKLFAVEVFAPRTKDWNGFFVVIEVGLCSGWNHQ